jgi:hypothetical protein
MHIGQGKNCCMLSSCICLSLVLNKDFYNSYILCYRPCSLRPNMFSDSGMHLLQFCSRNTGSYSRTLHVASTKLRNLKLTQFLKLKIWNNIFETRAILFIEGSKVQWDEGGGRMLLGDNRRRGDSFMFEFGFQLDFLLSSILGKIRLAPDLLERENCASRGVFVYICFPAFMK